MSLATFVLTLEGHPLWRRRYFGLSVASGLPAPREMTCVRSFEEREHLSLLLPDRYWRSWFDASCSKRCARQDNDRGKQSAQQQNRERFVIRHLMGNKHARRDLLPASDLRRLVCFRQSCVAGIKLQDQVIILGYYPGIPAQRSGTVPAPRSRPRREMRVGCSGTPSTDLG